MILEHILRVNLGEEPRSQGGQITLPMTTSVKIVAVSGDIDTSQGSIALKSKPQEPPGDSKEITQKHLNSVLFVYDSSRLVWIG